MKTESTKLKEFDVEVWETSYGFVRVKAKNRSDAEEKASEALSQGDVCWGKLDNGIGDVRPADPCVVLVKRRGGGLKAKEAR